MAEKKKNSFNKQADLNQKERESFDLATERIQIMQDSRKNHYGVDLDELWADADQAYIPHRLNTKSKKILVEDEEKGWRSTITRLGSHEWQSDVSKSNPYIKIQTALAILVDQNPSGVLTPTSEQYQATNELIKQLYERSWEVARSKEQLKLFVFNLAKYGWSIGRTYPLKVTRKSKVLTAYNPDNPDESEYEEKEVVVYNDIMRETLDPRNAWIDDMTRPADQFSMRDWCWRKVYDMDIAEEQFGQYPLWKKVQEGGNLAETPEAAEEKDDQESSPKNQVEVLFYENIVKDLFIVIANGVPVVIEPLPVSDAEGKKMLSCWHAGWNTRHANSPYGIGIYEATRFDNALLDRIRNMTIDQLTLSIYKMFFFQGTQSLTEGGEILVRPGVGKQVMDPKSIEWLDVPGPGNDAWQGLEIFQKDVDDASGITEPLTGEITGKTAFELAQAKESALKRLKNPLDNILGALNTEGYITISLIQLLYSIPEVYEIADPDLIEDYLKETDGDKELYERESRMNEETGEEEDVFKAKVFREFPLNLDKDEEGNLFETEDTRFFRIKPRFLKWRGTINVKAQSILSPSKQIDKALDLEMYNLLLPLMSQMAQERILLSQNGQPATINDLTHGKAAQEIVRLYDKDPRDVFPDAWMQEDTTEDESLFIDANEQAQQQVNQMLQQGPGPQGQPQQPQGQLQPERMVANTQPPSESQGIVGKVSSALGSLFR